MRMYQNSHFVKIFTEVSIADPFQFIAIIKCWTFSYEYDIGTTCMQHLNSLIMEFIISSYTLYANKYNSLTLKFKQTMSILFIKRI